jgi:AAA+ superfamily predicted ATPase
VSDRVEALRAAVAATPDLPALRLLLADELVAAGRGAEAVDEFATLLAAGALPGGDALRAGHVAVAAGRADVARGLLEAARAAGVVEGLPALQAALDGLLRERGLVAVPAEPGERSSPFLAPEESRLTFADVGGLAEVKKVLHRMVVLPQSRPDLLQRYGRRAGGGVLLYGPPGCGKTLLARAVAGECGLPFLAVRIEDVVDPFFGTSERNLSRAFQEARDLAPCLLFVDELDALGFSRHRSTSDTGRRLAEVLLQELDGATAGNEGVVVLGATNAPWDVDDAMLRPGRFDRRVFVPPPDEEARRAVLEVLVAGTHHRDLDLRAVAAATELFSGADLRGAVERALDEVIDEALAGGGEPPLTGAHLRTALAGLRPTTLDWLLRARDQVEFANAAQRWDDVAAYLSSRRVRRLLGRA